MTSLRPPAPRPAKPSVSGVERLACWLKPRLLTQLDRLEGGHITLIEADGECRQFGRGGPLAACVTVHRERTWRRLALGGTVGDEPALAERLPQRRALVFLVSDFHWPTGRLARILAHLARHDVVPVVVWDAREYADLPRRGLVHLVDPETGRRRTLWMRQALAEQWRAAYAGRRAELTRRFTRSGRPPLFAGPHFVASTFTDYFLRTA